VFRPARSVCTADGHCVHSHTSICMGDAVPLAGRPAQIEGAQVTNRSSESILGSMRPNRRVVVREERR
jgi:hypothetical protein